MMRVTELITSELDISFSGNEKMIDEIYERLSEENSMFELMKRKIDRSVKKSYFIFLQKTKEGKSVVME
jgi:hypothetical protein